jgi:hypothetical protein
MENKRKNIPWLLTRQNGIIVVFIPIAVFWLHWFYILSVGKTGTVTLEFIFTGDTMIKQQK